MKGITMEEITIKDKNTNIILYLDSHNYYGYIFFKDNIKNIIDVSVLKYFNLFKLSTDCTKIDTKNGYEIFLDNKTGLKHYLHNGIDDINLLWKNNGTSSILYSEYHDNLQNRKYEQKIINIKGVIIGCTLIGLILSTNIRALALTKPPESISRIVFSEYSNLCLEDIHNLIYSSANLTEEEKTYLYNEAFLSDVLNTIEDYNFGKFSLKRSLTDLTIKTYDTENRPYKNSDNYVIGYYQPINYNTINIMNYSGLNKENAKIITHEFIHLCQENSCYYTTIKEACAELISAEYYPESKIDSYLDQIKALKILMEIIGPEPIWDYNFTGDFSKIEEKVKPYLNKKEYNEFLNDLVHDQKNEAINKKRMESLNNILSTLYKNIYNEDINANEIISLIKKNKDITRYYFNSRLINEENSYYIDYRYEDMSLEDAIRNGVVTAYATRERELSHDEALEYIQNDKIIINRKIDYTSTKIKIDEEIFKDNKIYITGTINDKYYENINIDELYKKGYINITYTIKEQKPLTLEEYMSNETKQYEIEYFSNTNTIMSNDNVTAIISKKIYIPTINQNNNINRNKTKK